jgi:hypothetical protein
MFVVFMVNRWLGKRGLRTRILACNFCGDSGEGYLVITDKQKVIDLAAPMVKFEENENSVEVKTHLEISDADLEYVTIRKWVKTKSRKRRSFKSLQIPNGASDVDRGRSATKVVRV